jgi:hypothetical protein
MGAEVLERGEPFGTAEEDHARAANLAGEGASVTSSVLAATYHACRGHGC